MSDLRPFEPRPRNPTDIVLLAMSAIGTRVSVAHCTVAPSTATAVTPATVQPAGRHDPRLGAHMEAPGASEFPTFAAIQKEVSK